MVFVNTKKFACESCIKGHRSSGCHHTDRPLYEIKKKGRPVSQCDRCRQLRKSRRVHSKCNCSASEPGTSSQPERRPVASGGKAPRFIPIAPALPNGLKDAFKASASNGITPPSTRQRVDSLLNPCSCPCVWECSCHKSETVATSSSNSSSEGLATLAHVAELCCSAQQPSDPDSAWHGRASVSHEKAHQRPKHVHVSRPPELPPFLFSDALSPTTEVPNFSVMPPIKEIESLAGSGCTCGVDCNCPGCLEHRGLEHADHERPDCGTACGTCVDHSYGIALPGHESSSTSSIIDRFFARAAALPAPPPNRKMGIGADLDPMNVIVYPMTAIEKKERGVPFGLIEIPKLECCGGRCGCPDGICGCGTSCDGCCSEHSHKDEPEKGTVVPNPSLISAAPHPPAPTRSCCSGA
ncbi:hypothetical protein D9758_012236 [Tetrapyrgos nigripes]|uniref:Copper-fist domain-containing protein n=1 Tax=Tetrapyrgos nigripes TaxID=182062 RepID=A0A8H5CC90_9AGAR|nr:hypothetical protein D9758_012236 [Tetrapyrgos nigripes]